VQKLLGGEGVKGVGGFSLICGKLRKHTDQERQGLEPLAIISNRCEDSQDVPWIASRREEVYGLSNTSYNDPIAWPKVEKGKALLLDTVNEAVTCGWDEEQLVEKLFTILDTDTLPAKDGQTFEQYISQLKHSIFIPPIGDDQSSSTVPKAEEIAAAGEAALSSKTDGHVNFIGGVKDESEQLETPAANNSNMMVGSYGTQRQTILLVDWEGKVTFIERALWDSAGNPICRGQGHMVFDFQIEGWNNETKNGIHMESHM
jgi:uncharacterized protein with NRDE domain